MNRDMRHEIRSGAVLLTSLLAACATGPQEVRDEGSERIEEAMRPEPHPEVIPEGIAMGSDAPPLAPPEPDGASLSDMVSSHGWSWGFGGPVISPGPRYGPWPGPMRYHLQPTPGGSIPGLLP
jgi:hypothetical protein